MIFCWNIINNNVVSKKQSNEIWLIIWCSQPTTTARCFNRWLIYVYPNKITWGKINNPCITKRKETFVDLTDIQYKCFQMVLYSFRHIMKLTYMMGVMFQHYFNNFLILHDSRDTQEIIGLSGESRDHQNQNCIYIVLFFKLFELTFLQAKDFIFWLNSKTWK